MKVTQIVGTVTLGLILLEGGIALAYEWQAYEGHSYALTETPGNWLEAQVQAETAGGNLVTINDAEENDWLVDTFGPLLEDNVWIGFYQPPGTPEPHGVRGFVQNGLHVDCGGLPSPFRACGKPTTLPATPPPSCPDRYLFSSDGSPDWDIHPWSGWPAIVRTKEGSL